MTDFYHRYQEDEREIAALLFADRSGILSSIRRLPVFLRFPQPSGQVLIRSTQEMIASGQVDAIISSSWWRGLWDRFVASLGPLLDSVSSRASIGAARQAGISVSDLEFENRSGEISTDLERKTSAGFFAAIAGATALGVGATRFLTALRERLGATGTQAERVNAWQGRVLRRGDASIPKTRREARARTLSALRARSAALGSDATVDQVTSTRLVVFGEAGVLVSNGNPLDNRTQDTHRAQTVITRASPSPAGRPWVASAPLRGLPPYRPRCRCWVELT